MSAKNVEVPKELNVEQTSKEISREENLFAKLRRAIHITIITTCGTVIEDTISVPDDTTDQDLVDFAEVINHAVCDGEHADVREISHP